MPLHILDPLHDSRWDAFVSCHPHASVFHQTGWLQALALTYDYRPLVLTTAAEGHPLSDGIVFAEIKSWITGCRLVSLPFADHCDPLLNGATDISGMLGWMQARCQDLQWKYVELRPLSCNPNPGPALEPYHSFWLHTLRLTPTLGDIFNAFHPGCMQRRIRRAERARLSYERSRSSDNLRDFYSLLLTTRRRHQLPPQPLAWFRNLIAHLGTNLDIRVVRRDGVPLGAILALRHGNTVVYKYGCSEATSHHLAAMPLLFWRLIEESKAENAEIIDFGRTELSNTGLIAFKDHMGTTRSRLTYRRYINRDIRNMPAIPRLPAVGRLFSLMPDGMYSRVGDLLYRHIG